MTDQIPAWSATETAVYLGPLFGDAGTGSLDAMHALRDWIAMHGINPGDVPATRNTIRRVTELDQIILEVHRRDPETGRKILADDRGSLVRDVVTYQLAAPPAPWPADIWRPAADKK